MLPSARFNSTLLPPRRNPTDIPRHRRHFLILPFLILPCYPSTHSVGTPLFNSTMLPHDHSRRATVLILPCFQQQSARRFVVVIARVIRQHNGLFFLRHQRNHRSGTCLFQPRLLASRDDDGKVALPSYKWFANRCHGNGVGLEKQNERIHTV